MNRNEFFRATGRVLLLGGFIFSGVYLAEKHKITGPGNCTSNNLCSGCSRIERCKLPEADKFRSNGKR